MSITSEQWNFLNDSAYYLRLLSCTRDAMVRWHPSISLNDIENKIDGYKIQMENKNLTPDELKEIYAFSARFFNFRINQFKFPGAHFIHAVQLASEGYHYEKVKNVMTKGENDFVFSRSFKTGMQAMVNQ